MKSRNPTSARRGERDLRLGWLLAALVLLVWPAALLHEATTVHAVCPEHGERLDVGEAGELTPEHGNEDGEPTPDDADEGGDHEECPLVLLAQLAGEARGEPEACVHIREAGATPCWGSTAALASIPLLLLAPKQSPPV